MAMKKFEFKNTVEELEIAGEKYTIDFSDDKIIQYNTSFERFFQKAQDIQKKQVKNLTTEEQNQLFADMRDLSKGMVEELLGEGSFEELYKKSGNSLMNMLDVLTFLAEYVQEKLNSLKSKQMQKYKGIKANVNAHPAARK